MAGATTKTTGKRSKGVWKDEELSWWWWRKQMNANGYLSNVCQVVRNRPILLLCVVLKLSLTTDCITHTIKEFCFSPLKSTKMKCSRREQWR